ncbi:MAG: tetratricopeptide repeat protein [Dysgonomonas sp.]
MKKIISITIFTFLLFNIACHKDETLLWEKVEEYLDKNQDSLIHYIKLIEHPENLLPPQRAKYGLILSDRLPANKENEFKLDHSLDYYTSAKDTTMMIQCYLAKSRYYKDSIYQEITFLNLAKDLALKANHRASITYLNLNIGYCYERLEDDEVAFTHFQKAEEYAPTNDFLYGLTHWNQARIYNKRGMKDKAIVSLLNVAENARVYAPRNLSSIYKQISDRYQELKNYEKALEYINLSFQYRTNIKEAPSYNLAKAIIFINTQELDSARLYLSKAIDSPNPYISNRALGFLYELNKKINQYDKAYYTRINEEDNFSSLESKEDWNILEQKYMKEKLKNENNQLRIEKQQQKNYSLVITIVLLLAFAFTYILYSYKKKQQILIKHKHEEQLLKEKALLHESQNLLLKRDNELALFQQKAATLRAYLFRKMSLYQKIPSLDKDVIKEVNNKKISLTEQDLIELRKTVDAAYNGFSKKLADSFPCLSEDEIIFCCLIKIEVDMQDLSDIYCISKAGITKRKMRIKKDKLKIETNNSLDSFIRHF